MSTVDPYKQAINQEGVDPYKQAMNLESFPFSQGTKLDRTQILGWIL